MKLLLDNQTHKLDEDGDVTEKELPYMDLVNKDMRIMESPPAFSLYVFCQPKSIILILLKTKDWKKYEKKLFEKFEWKRNSRSNPSSV